MSKTRRIFFFSMQAFQVEDSKMRLEASVWAREFIDVGITTNGQV